MLTELGVYNIKSFARRATLKEDEREILNKYLIENNKEYIEKVTFQKRVWLDIGFGSGENTASQAMKNSDVLVIGSEPYLKGVSCLLKKIEKDNIKNILIWPDDVRELILNILDNIIEKIFILFPDPWQKRSHNKRRLISSEFLKLLAKKMLPKGEIIMSTDYQEYAKWMQEQIKKSSIFSCSKISENDIAHYAFTKYHKKALEKQSTIEFFKLICDY